MHKIVCIGAGRLAYHLMPRLEQAGHHVIQVFNRTKSHADALMTQLASAELVDHVEEITAEADLYFFTIKDDAIPSIASQLSSIEDNQKIFVHCSGVSDLNVLPFERKGSFYPLQTFSYAHAIPWEETPLLITAMLPEVKKVLVHLAQEISKSVYTVSDEQKTRLHLAAVFANNFTNHMLMLSAKICKDHGLSFDILKPLIKETVEKALHLGPEHSQTGPAVRGDEVTIQKHLKLLEHDPSLASLYSLITDQIKEYHTH